MNFIGTYQYAKINTIELKPPKYCIRVLFNLVIVRKIGISCEVLKCLFFCLFINASFTSLSSV
ncbi:hypothetical protein COF68_34110 [Bacillus toyonensis]|nr:hypothetical protein CON93_00020 [Bacillus toyonensis]PEA71832.1 hypothetical protein COO00_14580 [Bacillus toyonensis]PEC39090.1 hypothetical protein CON60_13450 [Bacillus toyonensis]PED58936.1 hypothetical protein CON89_23415 [Bacillus toyonensis]PEJ86144.1 hypothetical protein CN687_25780 [Bacillus toyonensis]